jgi:hypothetical protein
MIEKYHFSRVNTDTSLLLELPFWIRINDPFQIGILLIPRTESMVNGFDILRASPSDILEFMYRGELLPPVSDQRL